MKEDKQFLRVKREELYKRMVELNLDAEQLRVYARQYVYEPVRRNCLLELSNVLDKEADDMDEICIAIENYLQFGKNVPFTGGF